MREGNKRLISIVVPVYNEVDNIIPCYDAITKVLTSINAQYNFEIIFTDNHSTDNTFDKLKYLANQDQNVRVIRFSRNFGFQRSILTGYLNASGDAVVQMDCDLQDPPELILDFIDKWEAGNQVVYGIRKYRHEGKFINMLRKMFYRLIDGLSEDRLPHDAGDFRLVDRVIIDELRGIDDYQPYLRGSVASMGFKQVGIPYSRNERVRGQSKFSFGDLITLALDGILNHSIIPLRLATFTGIIVSLITFLALFVYLFGRILFNLEWPPGFATTTVLILASLSLNALFLGIIGEYLGRIYQQVKKRPLTIVEEELNIKTDNKKIKGF